LEERDDFSCCALARCSVLTLLTLLVACCTQKSSLTITARDYNEVPAGESVDDEFEQQQHEENGSTATTTSLEPEHSSEAKDWSSHIIKSQQRTNTSW
jgi:hypothetical protein